LASRIASRVVSLGAAFGCIRAKLGYAMRLADIACTLASHR